MKKRFLNNIWFFEDFLPNERKTSTWGFLIDKIIYSGKSKFQKIEIFKTKEFGDVLVLDGLVQLSTKYEYIYHEMLVHPAFIYHNNPQIILIIGGGDGGVLREVLKYRVKEVYLVDIDKKVIEVSQKYLPSVSLNSFKDKRLKIFYEDAFDFVKRYKNYFDIIIDDITDDIGSPFSLWKKSFYKDVSNALKSEGIFAVQTGLVKEKFGYKAREKIRSIFPFSKLQKAFVDCFPLGEHSFFFASKRINFDKISIKEIEEKLNKLKIKTKYYSPKIHFASTII